MELDRMSSIKIDHTIYAERDTRVRVANSKFRNGHEAGTGEPPCEQGCPRRQLCRVMECTCEGFRRWCKTGKVIEGWVGLKLKSP